MSPTEHVCDYCNEIGGEYIDVSEIEDYDDDDDIAKNNWKLDEDRNFVWYYGVIEADRMREVIRLSNEYNFDSYCGFCNGSGYKTISIESYEKYKSLYDMTHAEDTENDS